MVSKTAFQIYLARYKHPRSFPSYQTQRHDLNQINSTKILYALKYYLELSSSKFTISTFSNISREYNLKDYFWLNAGATTENKWYLSKTEKERKQNKKMCIGKCPYNRSSALAT